MARCVEVVWKNGERSWIDSLLPERPVLTDPPSLSDLLPSPSDRPVMLNRPGLTVLPEPPELPVLLPSPSYQTELTALPSKKRSRKKKSKQNLSVVWFTISNTGTTTIKESGFHYCLKVKSNANFSLVQICLQTGRTY